MSNLETKLAEALRVQLRANAAGRFTKDAEWRHSHEALEAYDAAKAKAEHFPNHIYCGHNIGGEGACTNVAPCRLHPGPSSDLPPD